MSTDRASVDLHGLTRALRLSWGPDTCAPEDRPQWSDHNPARGQCITTVLVVHDFFGGELRRGEVHVDGERVDFHWWNRLPDGTDVDLTREQFAADEHVLGGEALGRPTGTHRVEAQYDLLRARVLDHVADVDETV